MEEINVSDNLLVYIINDNRLVKTFCRDYNKRQMFIKYCVDHYYTCFVPVLLNMLLKRKPEPIK